MPPGRSHCHRHQRPAGPAVLWGAGLVDRGAWLSPASLRPAGRSVQQEVAGMVPSYETMGDWLEEISQDFPDAFFEELDGGIQLEEQALPDPEFPPGEMYIMGEYCHDMLGRYIVLYYGSFAALSGRRGRGDLEGGDLRHRGPRVYPPHGGHRRPPRPGRQGRGVSPPGPEAYGRGSRERFAGAGSDPVPPGGGGAAGSGSTPLRCWPGAISPTWTACRWCSGAAG